MQTRTETITAPDGQTFDGHLVLPESGSGPGILVLQEIFGVNDYIRDACERLASLGYVAMAPDVFWRIEPGIDITDQTEAEWKEAIGYMNQLDKDASVRDVQATLTWARGQGVAQRLIEAMEALARQHFKAREMRVSCFNANSAGLLLYPRLGYALSGLVERRDHRQQRVALLQFSKPL